MVVGYILIKTVPSKVREAGKEIKNIPNIEIYDLTFPKGNNLGYDLLAEINVSDMTKIGEKVIKNIRSLENVIDTKTLTGTDYLFNESRKIRI